MSDMFDHSCDAFDRYINGECDAPTFGVYGYSKQEPFCTFCGSKEVRWGEVSKENGVTKRQLFNTSDGSVHRCKIGMAYYRFIHKTGVRSNGVVNYGLRRWHLFSGDTKILYIKDVETTMYEELCIYNMELSNIKSILRGLDDGDFILDIIDQGLPIKIQIGYKKLHIGLPVDIGIDNCINDYDDFMDYITNEIYAVSSKINWWEKTI